MAKFARPAPVLEWMAGKIIRIKPWRRLIPRIVGQMLCGGLGRIGTKGG
jgi:hypothetical protein